MFALIELILAILITYLFVYKTGARLKFLFLGYFFFCLALVMQLPLKILLEWTKEHFPTHALLPILLITTVSIGITQVTKYFSLKRFLKTKSYKNGILFGLGWATIESIDILKIFILNTVVSTIHLTLSNSIFVDPQYSLLEFAYFFIVNVSLTSLIIFAIITKKSYFLYFTIMYALFVHIGLPFISNPTQNLLIVVTFLFSLFIIFWHKQFE
jgi:hypothetical protein